VFSGSMVAVVTPMTAAGEIDLQAWEGLLQWHAQQGTDAVVVVGTTGESPTVTLAEAGELVRRAVKVLGDRVPVIAGTGTNSTVSTIERTRALAAAGAQAALVVTPYYNKPTQEGLYQHFRAVADASPIPLILYNVPSRTGVDLLPDTVVRLASHPRILGVKESTGSLVRVEELVARCGKDLEIYSGEDPIAVQSIAAGARGLISVTANVAPALMHEMCEHALAGRLEQAEVIDDRLQGLHRALFTESNPIPVKWAVAELGHIPGGLRLPLTPLSPQHHSVVREAMRAAGIP
jgi:4-hydroxy-tetrahydrodipicolinate synthase